MATSFYLRSKKGETSTIFARVRSRKNNLDIRISTMLETVVTDWENAHKSETRLKNFRNTKGKALFEKLDKIEATLNNMLDEDITTEAIADRIKAIVFAEEIAAEEERKKLEEEKRKAELATDLNSYIQQYIAEMQSGQRKNNKGLLYSPGTIKNKISFYSELCKYQEETGRVYNFNDITIDFYNDFVDFFNRKSYSPNTTGKHIKSLKEMMTAAREEGLHENYQTTLRAFKILSCEADTIYLTREEITAIEKLDLSAAKHKELDLCRDIFLVGVYIAQRYSDYHRINSTNIIILENGKQAIKLTQQKTKTKVVIPCSPALLRILAKYDCNLPSTYSQFINDNIKIVCRMAKINQKVEHVETKGAKVVTTQIEKYKLVTTHTARRTGATLMYLEGIDTLSIMKITGHKTEKEFKKYIRVGEEENALILSNSKFYNRLTVNK